MSLYAKRGVSAQKEEVHDAVKNLDAGLYPYAFCKIYKDSLAGDEEYVNIMHADGAGTKSILAYLYEKETDDRSVWRGIAQDAIVMNLDDLLCIGVYDRIIFNSTIDRNKHLIGGEILKEIIDGSAEVFSMLKSHGVNIEYLGGETADVGDVVRTVAVNGTMTARPAKSELITNEKISAGDVIVGLASFGKATYESEYNSGIGSNGLTGARHDMLSKYYAENFPEAFDPHTPADAVYVGKYKLADEIEVSYRNKSFNTNVGKLLLSPTRTYAPVLKKILSDHFDDVHGLIHCSGGGQTKCLKYLPGNFRIIKDNLFEPPIIFDLIAKSGATGEKEMYEVFNMGCRMEIYCKPEAAQKMIDAANSFEIDAQIVGRVEAADQKELVIRTGQNEFHY